MLTLQRWGLALAITLVLIAALAVPKLCQSQRRTSPPRPKKSPNTSLRVKVHRVAPVDLSERLATIGTVRANESVEIVSEISGKIAAIHFDEGSRVAEGRAPAQDRRLRARRRETAGGPPGGARPAGRGAAAATPR